MAVFTSAYKGVAHGGLNWDTQLDADMTTLETILLQASWTPTIGGSGFTLGTSGGTNGYVTRLGQRVMYNGRLAFGTSAAWGSSTPSVNLLNVYGAPDQTISSGDGLYFRASGGNPIPLALTPVAGGTGQAIFVVQSGALAQLSTLGAAPAQSDYIVFRADTILA